MVQYKRKLLNIMLLGYGGLILLLIGMTTGARFLNSDVLYQDGFWVVALDVAIAIADLLAFVVSAVVVIYGIYLIGCREMMTVYSAYLSLTVLLNVAKVCIGWIIFPGTLPKTPEELITVLLESLVFIVLIDCLRLFIIGFITTKQLAKHESARKEYNRKANIIGNDEKGQRSIAFPFSRFISLKNPIQAACVSLSLVYWLTFLIQYVYYALMNLIKLNTIQYVEFQIAELVFYAIFACIAYCIAVYGLIKFDEKMPKLE